MVSNSKDELTFLHKLLLINTHKFPGFVKRFSANTKLSKTQLSKMLQLGEFLGRLLGLLLKKAFL